MCEELLCFFFCSVSFLFLSLCSVVHYARDCSHTQNSLDPGATWLRKID